MANSDKNIVIIPNRNLPGQPNVVFTGNANVPMTLRVTDDNSLSFENITGQLFSISNNVTSGSIFSVNDISGIPIINVDASGNVSLSAFGGNVGVGTATPLSPLHVFGNIRIGNTSTIGGVVFSDGTFQATAASGSAFSASNIAVVDTTTNATFYPTFVEATTGNISIRADSMWTFNPSTNQLSLTGNAWIQNSGRFGNLSITNSTASTSSTTGALIVSGGAGIANGIIAGGNIGIGTSSTVGFTNAALAVYGNIQISNVSGRQSSIRFPDGSILNSGNIANVIIVDSSANNNDYYVPFVDTVAGSSVIRADTEYTYNPSTNRIKGAEWAGRVINVDVGGTGFTSISNGDLLYGTNDSLLLGKLPIGSIDKILTTNGSELLWGAVNLSNTTITTGQLPMSRGGTSSDLTPVSGSILYSTSGNVRLAPTNQLFFDNITGNFGIGIASPTQRVDVRGNIYTTGSLWAGNISVTNTTSSTSTITGALRVAGGIGVAGNIWASNAYITSNIGIGTSDLVRSVLRVYANNTTDTVRIRQDGSGNSLIVSDSANDTTPFIVDGIGRVGVGTFPPRARLEVWGNVRITEATQIANLSITNSTAATSTTSGALIVAGGAGIAGNVYVGGRIFGVANTAFNASNLSVTSTTTNATFYPAFVEATTGNIGLRTDPVFTFNPSTNQISLIGNAAIQNSISAGNIAITNSTAATSSTTGALTVAGGVGIGGNLYVGGTIFGVANTSFNASNVSVFNTTTNATFYPTFVEATTGNISIRADVGLTYNPNTDVFNAGTFNATSLTNGGFQGIATDSATQPSFTWTGGLTSGLYYDSSTISVNTTVSGTNRFSVQTTQLRPTVPIGLGDDAYRGPILTFGAITGGSGYVDGSYTAVALTGGNGSIASANITVTNSSVSSVTLVAEGGRYIAGDVLSVANTGVGGSGTGFSVPVSTVRTAAINIYGSTSGTLPPRIRLMNTDTTLGGGQELGTVLFGANDAATGGRGDKVWLQGVAAGSSGGGTLRVYTSLNAGEPTLSLTVTPNSTSFPGQIISTLTNNTAEGGGQIYLNGTGNRIDWNTNGVAPPAFTTRSAGTKLVLYPAITAAAVDYALGIDSSTLWFSVPDAGRSFKWYGGTTLGATLTGAGALTLVGALSTTNGTFSGNVNITSTTAATSTSTGALTVAGGAGIGGSLYVAGNLIVNGNVTYINTNVAVIEDPAVAIGTGPNGTPLTTPDSYDRGLEYHYYSGGGDRYGFIGWQNSTGQFVYISNASAGSTTGIYAGALGDASFGNITIGSASNTPTPSISTSTGALIIQGAGGIGIGGNIYVGGRIFGVANTAFNASNVSVTNTSSNATFYPAFVEATSGNIGIRAGSSLTFNPSTNQLSLTGNAAIQNSLVVGNLSINNTTASTSSTTGALTVAGGVGIVGNIFAGSNILVTGQVGIGTSSPRSRFDVWGDGGAYGPIFNPGGGSIQGEYGATITNVAVGSVARNAIGQQIDGISAGGSGYSAYGQIISRVTSNNVPGSGPAYGLVITDISNVLGSQPGATAGGLSVSDITGRGNGNAFGLRIGAVTYAGNNSLSYSAGLLIENSIINSNTAVNAYAINSLSTAKSYFAGNIGVGISTFDNPLAIARNDSSTIIGDSTAVLKISNSNGGALNQTNGIEFFIGTNATSNIARLAGIYGVYTNYNVAGLGGALAFATNTAGDAVIDERMRITSTGLVGIGTTVPVSLLHLNGALTYGGVTLSNSVTGTGSMVLSNNPTLTAPMIGQATGNTLTLSGADTTPLVIERTASLNVSAEFRNSTGSIFIGQATGGDFAVDIDNNLNASPLLRVSNIGLLTISSLSVTNSSSVGNISVTNTTAATSTTSGALTVASGVGVGGNLYVGGTIFGVANTAFNASNISVINTTTNAAFYPTFVEATSGNIGIRVDSGLTYNPSTDVLSSGTFNATSLTNGGFQGIATDSATQPSFTWTGALTSGIWYNSSTVAVNTTVSGVNRFSVQTTQLRPTVPIGLGDDAYRGPILTFGAITGGSGYVDGSYTAVALTGGSGSLATANITIASGSVTAVTLVREGNRYIAGDVISVANTSVGGSGVGFSVPVATVRNAAINIYGTETSTLPPRIRLMNSSNLSGGIELGSLLFGANDSSAGGRGDKVQLLAVAESTSAGGQLRVLTSVNAGEPKLALSVTGAGALRLFNSTGTFYHEISNTPTANRTVTIPDSTFTVAGLSIAQTFSAAQTFSSAITYGGVTLANSVTGTGSMVLSASPTISTVLNVQGLNNADSLRVYATGGTKFLTVKPETATNTAQLFYWTGAAAGTLELPGALRYGSVTLDNSVTGTGSMVLSANPTLTGTITNTGSLQVSNSGRFGNISITNSTAATSTITGALTVAGGVGVGNGIVAGGNVGIGTSSTSGFTNSQLAVYGNIQISNVASRQSGIRFPDNTVQTTAAVFPNQIAYQTMVANVSLWNTLEFTYNPQRAGNTIKIECDNPAVGSQSSVVSMTLSYWDGGSWIPLNTAFCQFSNLAYHEAPMRCVAAYILPNTNPLPIRASMSTYYRISGGSGTTYITVTEMVGNVALI